MLQAYWYRFNIGIGRNLTSSMYCRAILFISSRFYSRFIFPILFCLLNFIVNVFMNKCFTINTMINFKLVKLFFWLGLDGEAKMILNVVYYIH